MKSEIRSLRSKVGNKVPVALAVLLASALAGRIAAAIGVPVPVEDLAKRADAVVHGKVDALECTRDPAGRIFTRVELDVAEVWKGKPAGRFTLVLAGGVLGARKVAVVGGPEYRLGEEVVVFTACNESGEPVTLDLAQGKFTVETAQASPFSTSAAAPRKIFIHVSAGHLKACSQSVTRKATGRSGGARKANSYSPAARGCRRASYASRVRPTLIESTFCASIGDQSFSQFVVCSSRACRVPCETPWPRAAK